MIKEKLAELDTVNTELDKFAPLVNELRRKKKELDQFVQDYLKDHNYKVLRHNGKLITLKDTTRRTRKKLNVKKQDCETILSKYGIRDAKKAVEELMEAQKGSKEDASVVNFD